MILIKLWLHISDAEQLKRFKRREKDPLKSWKLTEEDWRNREKRPQYSEAVEDMLARTDQPHAPWDVIAAESKRYARVSVIETAIKRIEEGMVRHDMAVPEPLERAD
jgi:AMP-polyphosphate phosphotransferase